MNITNDMEKITTCVGFDGLLEWMASCGSTSLLFIDKNNWVCRWSSSYSNRVTIGKNPSLLDAVQETLSKSGLSIVYKDDEYFEIYKR